MPTNPQFNVFSLADVYAKSEALNRSRQQGEMELAKMQEYQRALREQQTLGDIYARSIETTPGAPPERLSPEMGMIDEQGNPYTLVSDQGPSRTDFSYNKAFENLQKLPANLKGPIAQKLHEAWATEEDRRLKMLLAAQKERQGDLKHPADMEDASGRLYRTFINNGSQVVMDAKGSIVDPSKIPGLKYTKGNTYIQVAGPGGQTVVQAVPRAGGASPSYTAPVQSDIEQVGKEYKESLEPIVPVMDRLDKLITPIEKAGKKIPGVGFANNVKIAQLANDKGVGGNIYRDSIALSNAILKIRSGLAVTAQEEARTLIEMGRNPLASSEAFLSQFRKLQDAVDKMHDRLSSQYGKASEIFDERQRSKGGYLSSKSPWRLRKEQSSGEWKDL